MEGASDPVGSLVPAVSVAVASAVISAVVTASVISLQDLVMDSVVDADAGSGFVVASVAVGDDDSTKLLPTSFASATVLVATLTSSEVVATGSSLRLAVMVETGSGVVTSASVVVSVVPSMTIVDASSTLTVDVVTSVGGTGLVVAGSLASVGPSLANVVPSGASVGDTSERSLRTAFFLNSSSRSTLPQSSSLSRFFSSVIGLRRSFSSALLYGVGVVDGFAPAVRANVYPGGPDPSHSDASGYLVP